MKSDSILPPFINIKSVGDTILEAKEPSSTIINNVIEACLNVCRPYLFHPAFQAAGILDTGYPFAPTQYTSGFCEIILSHKMNDDTKRIEKTPIYTMYRQWLREYADLYVSRLSTSKTDEDKSFTSFLSAAYRNSKSYQKKCETGAEDPEDAQSFINQKSVQIHNLYKRLPPCQKDMLFSNYTKQAVFKKIPPSNYAMFFAITGASTGNPYLAKKKDVKMLAACDDYTYQDLVNYLRKYQFPEGIEGEKQSVYNIYTLENLFHLHLITELVGVQQTQRAAWEAFRADREVCAGLKEEAPLRAAVVYGFQSSQFSYIPSINSQSAESVSKSEARKRENVFNKYQAKLEENLSRYFLVLAQLSTLPNAFSRCILISPCANTFYSCNAYDSARLQLWSDGVERSIRFIRDFALSLLTSVFSDVLEYIILEKKFCKDFFHIALSELHCEVGLYDWNGERIVSPTYQLTKAGYVQYERSLRIEKKYIKIADSITKEVLRQSAYRKEAQSLVASEVVAGLIRGYGF